VLHFMAHDWDLQNLLEEISLEEEAEGRGLMSVLVVSKDGEMRPSEGFFFLAASLGRDTSDKFICWTEEANKVYHAWKSNP